MGLPPLASRRLIWLAGLALVTAGIICLILSGMVVPAGSWLQGTLDAFGVGFIVGGIVDVLAITGLNQVLTSDQERRAILLQAEAILANEAIDIYVRRELAKELVIRSGHQLDREVVAALKDFINNIPPRPSRTALGHEPES